MGRRCRMWDAGGREMRWRDRLLRVCRWAAGNNHLSGAYDAIMQFVALLRYHHNYAGGHLSRWLVQNGLMEIWVEHFIFGRDWYTFVSAKDAVQLLFD